MGKGLETETKTARGEVSGRGKRARVEKSGTEKNRH
jgi:hypothetical protein